MSEISKIGNLATQLFSSTTVAAGVLFYFGWARFDTILKAFHVPPRLLGYPSSELILASVTALFYPALVAIFVGLLILVFRSLIEVLKSPRFNAWLTRLWIALSILSTVASLTSQLSIVNWNIRFPWEPLGLLIGLSTLFWGGTNSSDMVPFRDRPRWLAYSAFLVLLFWWIGLYAQFRGAQFVDQIRDNPALLPAASFVTRDPIGLPGEENQGSLDHPQYMHSGYKVLAHSVQTLVLLPPGWQPDKSPVVTLKVDNSILYLEFSAAL